MQLVTDAAAVEVECHGGSVAKWVVGGQMVSGNRAKCARAKNKCFW